MNPAFLALADNTLVDNEGITKSFDYLLDEESKCSALRFNDRGSFASSHITDIEPHEEFESIRVVHLTLFSGETFTLLEGTQILAADNNWVAIEDEHPGDGVKTLTYNPSLRHPQLTPKVISSIELETLSFAPVVGFNISSASDNFLLASEQEENITILIPVRPTRL
jgi:hypothetical protein